MEKVLGKATRDAYGAALVEVGKDNSKVVVLDADLSKSTKTVIFQKACPERFINVGIQEANLVGVASGLAACGKIPFISSFASFLVCKGYDQMRMGVAFSEQNVKMVASHGGISIGEDGASQMSIEDVALMSTMPGVKVIVPADEYSTRQTIINITNEEGPAYVRTGRPKAPIVHDENVEVEIGKGITLREGNDLTIVANGLLVYEALAAAEELEKQGISATVIDMHTVKPLDEELLLKEAEKTGKFVVAEEHSIWGGLGSAVSTFLASKKPCPIAFVAIEDTYAESATPDELLDKYGLRSVNIIEAAKKVLS